MSDALRSLIKSARQRAARIGPMHAMWDTILDAEAILEGKETLHDWGKGEAAKQRISQKLMAEV